MNSAEKGNQKHAAPGDYRSKRKRWDDSFPYKVDYNDHFETPATAYEDISPLIDHLFPGTEKRRSQITLYDPYYCNGRTGTFLKNLGFQVIHEKRDFYKDIADQTVPAHDVFITNPPYSNEHKQTCLEYCVKQLRDVNKKTPFFVLMPSYVATKSYFRDLLLVESDNDIVYWIPEQDYAYDHPEGTGQDISPFASLWFCGVGKQNVAPCLAKFANRVVTSLLDLERRKLISLNNRANPKQRRKKQKKLRQDKDDCSTIMPISKNNESNGNETTDNMQGTCTQSHHKEPQKNKKQSKYRNANGERTKRRF